jgi:hypothetical protein
MPIPGTTADAGTSPSAAGPYKGLDSYDVGDADFFFGREREATSLVARILSSRLSVLYAPSGAGKTSLLNARVVPALESRNWQPVRIRFDNDPVEAVRDACARYVFPPLATEVQILEAACASLALAPDSTISALLDAYDGVPLSDPRRRRLSSSLALPPSRVSSARGSTVTPYWTRVLRGSVALEGARDHLLGVLEGPLDATDEALTDVRAAVEDLRLGTPIADVLGILKSPALHTAYARRLKDIADGTEGLAGFFRALYHHYGQHRSEFLIVLLLDQFEELFTRFGDPGVLAGATSDLQDWQRREAFLHELECLFAEADSGDGQDVERLPLRFVISTREEYVGRLDRISLFAPTLTDSMFRLGFLAPDDAREAITNPPDAFGYTYAPEAVKAIVSALQREQFVEPGPLSMVCNEVWERLVKPQLASVAGPAHVVTLADLQAEPHCGVSGLVQLFLDGFLADLDATQLTDALEILERLIISSTRTRNIIDESQLLRVPFRSVSRRRDVLDRLVDRKLLRREKRLGGLFVEITHEILIPPILARVTQAAQATRSLRAAQRTLEGIGCGDPPELDRADFWALDESADRLEWPAWATDLMLRSAVLHGAPAERIRNWAALYEQSRSPEHPVSLAADEQGASGSWDSSRYLTLAEIRSLEAPTTPATWPSSEQRERIVRSLLLSAGRNDATRIAQWVKSLVQP